MRIQYGKGKTQFGPGVDIKLTGNEVAMATYTYLTAHGVRINGAATVRVNGELCCAGSVYIDPSGEVIENGKVYSGRGDSNERLLESD